MHFKGIENGFMEDTLIITAEDIREMKNKIKISTKNYERKMLKLKLHNAIFTEELEQEAYKILENSDKLLYVFEECKNLNNKDDILNKCRWVLLMQNNINKQLEEED